MILVKLASESTAFLILVVKIVAGVIGKTNLSSSSCPFDNSDQNPCMQSDCLSVAGFATQQCRVKIHEYCKSVQWEDLGCAMNLFNGSCPFNSSSGLCENELMSDIVLQEKRDSILLTQISLKSWMMYYSGRIFLIATLDFHPKEALTPRRTPACVKDPKSLSACTRYGRGATVNPKTFPGMAGRAPNCYFFDRLEVLLT